MFFAENYKQSTLKTDLHINSSNYFTEKGGKETILKNLKCILDFDTKQVTVGNNMYTLVNGRMYRKSEVTETYPYLFETVECKNESECVVETIIEPTIIEEAIIKPVKKTTTKKVEPPVQKKVGFNWVRFLLLLSAVLLVAAISAYLRIHGIATIFHIDLVMASILVAGFITSEFAISSLLLREITSKFHHIMNMLVLGGIQVILIAMSFVFEFSTMSNWVLSQKNEVVIIDKKEDLLQQTMNDYDIRIKAVQQQIEITPPDYISKRSRLTTQINTLIEQKNNERDKIQGMLEDSNITDKKIHRTGFEVTSKVLGIDEEGLTKVVLIVIAAILNILYVAFIYGFVSEWKRRGQEGV